MTEATLAAAEVHELLQAGTARPLLEGHFPVPVQIDGKWWYVPTNPATGAEPDTFVPADNALAAEFEQLARRRRAAETAVRDRGERASS
jgi:hypothetical protein